MPYVKLSLLLLACLLCSCRRVDQVRSGPVSAVRQTVPASVELIELEDDFVSSIMSLIRAEYGGLPGRNLIVRFDVASAGYRVRATVMSDREMRSLPEDGAMLITAYASHGNIRVFLLGRVPDGVGVRTGRGSMDEVCQGCVRSYVPPEYERGFESSVFIMTSELVQVMVYMGDIFNVDE